MPAKESKHGFSLCFVHCFKHKPLKEAMRGWHASVTLGLFKDKDCFLPCSGFGNSN